MAVRIDEFRAKLYLYFNISCAFLYFALFLRWLILLPLVTSKFLPGGIHEFLCYLMLYSSIGDILWSLKFNGISSVFLDRSLLKRLNFLYFVVVMHYYDDYEHAPVLKNASYSNFIIGLSFSQSYHHWCQLFRSLKGGERKTAWSRLNMFIAIPLLYLSEFYLLLLNTQNGNYHNGNLITQINRIVLIVYLPICMHTYKKLLTS